LATLQVLSSLRMVKGRTIKKNMVSTTAWM
jgi:hypothetical protein